MNKIELDLEVVNELFSGKLNSSHTAKEKMDIINSYKEIVTKDDWSVDIVGTLSEEDEVYEVTSELNLSLIERNIDKLDMRKISMNENIDISFIRQFKDFLHWRTLSINYQFTEVELLEFFEKIDWKSAILVQYACTLTFIEDNNLNHIIEDYQQINKKFIVRANNEFSDVSTLLYVCENNKKTIHDDLVNKLDEVIKNYTTNNTNNRATEQDYIEVMFEDDNVYTVPGHCLIKMRRDLKIEMVTNDDIISSIRNVVESFDVDTSRSIDGGRTYIKIK